MQSGVTQFARERPIQHRRNDSPDASPQVYLAYLSNHLSLSYKS
jgi:hypothetical protein